VPVSAETTPEVAPVHAGQGWEWSWKLAPAALVAVSAIPLFVLHERLIGLPLLFAGVALAALVDRTLFRHLALIALGLTIISTMSVKADLSNEGMVRFAITLTAAVVVPYLVSRYVFKERIVQFPLRRGKPWTRAEWTYLVAILVAGYLILPIYFIGTEVIPVPWADGPTYENWPEVPTLDLVLRLLVGVNFVGLWDELFFICLVFAFFRHHFPMWQANLLQAVVFTAFLWEIGYTAWGPLMTFPFAILQGYMFQLTKSLPFVVTIHLSFDMIIWAILVNAHNPDVLDIFITAPR
jgi:membrane protease YdiL (CAAX protease family)